MTDLDKHIQEYLEYNPHTGIITWKKKKPKNNRVKVGAEAGSVKSGYRVIQIDGDYKGAHRVAWFLYYGEWPKHMIDHINGIKDDNRISNLREATALQNSQNQSIRKGGSSKYKGVFWYKISSKWKAQIKINHKGKHLGYYLTEEEAALAYNKAALEYFGEYAYLNEVIKTP